MPEGAGAHFVAEALKGHDVKNIKKVILHNVINPESFDAYKAGALAEDTLVARHAAKALKQLGIKATTYRYEEVGSAVNIIIDTGR